MERKVERSVTRRISIGGKKYRTNYKSRPLRYFEVFERHSPMMEITATSSAILPSMNVLLTLLVSWIM
jgi:hypothetical protein